MRFYYAVRKREKNINKVLSTNFHFFFLLHLSSLFGNAGNQEWEQEKYVYTSITWRLTKDLQKKKKLKHARKEKGDIPLSKTAWRQEAKHG